MAKGPQTIWKFWGEGEDEEEKDWRGAYDYELDTPLNLSWNKNKKEEKKVGQEWWERETEWTNDWNKFQQTGEWHGYNYYQKPTLDYKYVEQMANAFSAKYNVEVRVGSVWGIDLRKKVLTYRPEDLMFGTKAHLIATLLHEIGHLRYSTYIDDIPNKGKFFQSYYDSCFEVMNLFEDFRIDKLMLKSYEGAEDVFESNKPVVKEIAEKYEQSAINLKLRTQEAMDSLVGKIMGMEKDYQKIELKKHFGTDNLELVKKKIEKVKKEIDKGDNLFNYLASILMTGYGQKAKMNVTMRKRVNDTKKAIPLSIKAKTTGEVINVLNKEVYPKIEDLLKDVSSAGNSVVAKAFGADTASKVQSTMDDCLMSSFYLSVDNESYGDRNNPKSRTSGHSDENVLPKAWKDGDYDALKESVESAIRELVSRLTFLRRQELVPRWQPGERRGRFDVKSVRKYVTGSMRMFRKKIEVIDTISSYAFSLLVDISGSMNGERIIHTTRGLIILSEVFEKMRIPYEVNVFHDLPDSVKLFNDGLTADIKSKIGGLTNGTRGGTNLYKALETKEIRSLAERDEKNKILIILSDGGVSYGKIDYEKLFQKLYDKNRIKTLGIGINCGDEIVKLCLNQGVSVDVPAALPEAFSDILKQTILNKK